MSDFSLEDTLDLIYGVNPDFENEPVESTTIARGQEGVYSTYDQRMVFRHIENQSLWVVVIRVAPESYGDPEVLEFPTRLEQN